MKAGTKSAQGSPLGNTVDFLATDAASAYAPIAMSTPARPTGRALRDIAHPRCVACSPSHPFGLMLEFEDMGNGRVQATFPCPDSFEGYPGRVHGGIVSTMLDAAMCNSLFALGYQGVTAELTVKFKSALALNHTALIEASVTKDLYPLYLLEAAVYQDGDLKASATAKFIVT